MSTRKFSVAEAKALVTGEWYLRMAFDCLDGKSNYYAKKKSKRDLAFAHRVAAEHARDMAVHLHMFTEEAANSFSAQIVADACREGLRNGERWITKLVEEMR